MAKELEVKVLNIDKEELKKKLVEIGAKLIKIELQVNTIFMNIDEDIEGVGKGYLRVRESKNLMDEKTENIFTFKRNISQNGFRENEEIETKVEDKDSLIKILDCLNIKVKHIGKKERIRYEFEGIKFDIDTWDKETYPNPYLEIEVEDIRDIQKATDILNINIEDITTKSLKELRAEFKK